MFWILEPPCSNQSPYRVAGGVVLLSPLQLLGFGRSTYHVGVENTAPRLPGNRGGLWTAETQWKEEDRDRVG